MSTIAWTPRPTEGLASPPAACSPSSRRSRAICEGRSASPVTSFVGYRMTVRPQIVVAFAAGAMIAFGAVALQRVGGIGAPASVAQREAKPAAPAPRSAVLAMDDERI